MRLPVAQTCTHLELVAGALHHAVLWLDVAVAEACVCVLMRGYRQAGRGVAGCARSAGMGAALVECVGVAAIPVSPVHPKCMQPSPSPLNSCTVSDM